MAASRLLPPWLATTSERFGTPHLAIILSSVLGYATCLLVFYLASATAYVLPLCLLFAFSSTAAWLLGIVAVLGFQGHDGIEAVFFLGLLLIVAVYYVLVAKKRQIMSEEETKILLVAHISRFNQNRKHHGGGRGGASRTAKQSTHVSSTAATVPTGRLARAFSSKNANKYETEASTIDRQ